MPGLSCLIVFFPTCLTELVSPQQTEASVGASRSPEKCAQQRPKRAASASQRSSSLPPSTRKSSAPSKSEVVRPRRCQGPRPAPRTRASTGALLPPWRPAENPGERSEPRVAQCGLFEDRRVCGTDAMPVAENTVSLLSEVVCVSSKSSQLTPLQFLTQRTAVCLSLQQRRKGPGAETRTSRKPLSNETLVQTDFLSWPAEACCFSGTRLMLLSSSRLFL